MTDDAEPFNYALVTWQSALDMASIYLGLLDEAAGERADEDSIASSEQYRIWQSMHQMDPIRADPSLPIEKVVQEMHFASVKEATLAIHAVLAAAKRLHGIDPHELLLAAREAGPLNP